MSDKPRAVFFHGGNLDNVHFGHFNPTLTLVSLLAERGYEVNYFGPLPAKSKVEGCGATFHTYGWPQWGMTQAAMHASVALGHAPTEACVNEVLFENALPATVGVMEFVVAQVRQLKPQLIVSDAAYPWAKLSAQVCGVPYIASLSSTYMTPEERKIVMGFVDELPVSKSAAKWLLDKYGIEYTPHNCYTNYSPYTVTWTVPEFLFPPGIGSASDVPDFVHYLGAAMLPNACARNPSEADEAWLQSLAEKKRASGSTVVYVSMGTVFGQERWTADNGSLLRFYDAVCKALGPLPNTIVVIAAGKEASSVTAIAPEGFLVCDHTPQKQLLEQGLVDLGLFHGGMNTTQEALCCSVPMVVMPCFGDQNMNAARVAALGCGVHIPHPAAPGLGLDMDHVTPEVLGAAVSEISDNLPKYQAASTRMRQLFAARAKYLTDGAVDDILSYVDKFDAGAAAVATKL
ncbi:hypothetical protein FOA52_002092 [Chlamydomonas sp. UWO 241]|nr:hypothetical protein FOA52_002092 [Chlamydomonas sp. UWO 241]